MERTNSFSDRDQALLSLEGRRLGDFSVHVELGPVSTGGARYFQIFLEKRGGQQGSQPYLRGLYHTGREPSYNWIEVLHVNPKALIPSSDGALRREAPKAVSKPEEALLSALAELLPAGGHMMIEYESRPDTQRALALGIPAAATPLGSLLARLGCGTAFKDWYFTEGWSEGPRKLQGYKALNQEHARRRARSTAMELLDFLARPRDSREDEVVGQARRRALEILRSLKTGDDELDRRIGQTLERYRKVKATTS